MYDQLVSMTPSISIELFTRKSISGREGRMQEPAPNKDSTLGIVVVPAIVAVIAGRRHKT